MVQNYVVDWKDISAYGDTTTLSSSVQEIICAYGKLFMPYKFPNTIFEVSRTPVLTKRVNLLNNIFWKVFAHRALLVSIVVRGLSISMQ